MKPMLVRSTRGLSASRSISARSRPGAAKPVQETTTRWRDAGEVVLQVEGRPERQIGGALGVDLHPPAGVRERALAVEPGIVELPGLAAAREHRVAALDSAALRHAPEQPPVAAGGEQTGRVVGEQTVDLVRRNGASDRVEMSFDGLQGAFPHVTPTARAGMLQVPSFSHDRDHSDQLGIDRCVPVDRSAAGRFSPGLGTISPAEGTPEEPAARSRWSGTIPRVEAQLVAGAGGDETA